MIIDFLLRIVTLPIHVVSLTIRTPKHVNLAEDKERLAY